VVEEKGRIPFTQAAKQAEVNFRNIERQANKAKTATELRKHIEKVRAAMDRDAAILGAVRPSERLDVFTDAMTDPASLVRPLFGGEGPRARYRESQEEVVGKYQGLLSDLVARLREREFFGNAKKRGKSLPSETDIMPSPPYRTAVPGQEGEIF